MPPYIHYTPVLKFLRSKFMEDENAIDILAQQQTNLANYQAELVRLANRITALELSQSSSS